MNKLFTACALSILTAVSAFGQGLRRNSVTTNAFLEVPPSAGNALVWSAFGYWTNGSASATATNAISNSNGLGTNTTLRGFFSTIGMTNTGAFSNSGNVYLGSQLYVQGSSTLVGNVGAQGDLVQTGSGVAQLLATTVTGAFTNNGSAGVGGNVIINGSIRVNAGAHFNGKVTNANDVHYSGDIIQGTTGGQTAWIDQMRVSSLAWFTNVVTHFAGVNFTTYKASGAATNAGVLWLEDDLNALTIFGGQVWLNNGFFTNSLMLPNGAAVITDAFGEIAADNDAWAASRGAVQFFDGTGNTLLVGVLSSDTPSNGQVPMWNTGGTITWETVSGVGGGLTTNENQFLGVPLAIKDGALLTNLVIRGMTNTGSFSNSSRADIGGNLSVGGSASFNGGSVNINGGDLLHTVLTASTVLYGNSSKQVVSIANGTGMLTNNGAGVVGWMAIPGGTASTNNAVMANNYEAVGSIEVTNNFINYWHAGVPGPVATTNWLYATNGDSQFYNLFSHTNMQYVPLSGAYASNHIGVAVAFTQDSTGGFYPTNNGLLIPVRTNANASTMVYFQVANGATNFSVAYPFVMGPAPLNATFHEDVVQFHRPSGTWTNGVSTGTGAVVRAWGNVFSSITNLGESTFVGASHHGTANIGTANVITLAVQESYLTNNIRQKVSTVAGVGGANTNFTLSAGQGAVYIDAGTTNVNIVALIGYTPDGTFVERGTVVLTNRTATARLFSLGSITNNWISLQQFDGIQAPFTITNSQAGRFDWEAKGTNVQYSYKPMALPSN